MKLFGVSIWLKCIASILHIYILLLQVIFAVPYVHTYVEPIIIGHAKNVCLSIHLYTFITLIELGQIWS